MNKYLLLRSNKQTGPYTLEEIRAMGLKAYDLIWVEGKSAAWRYPGEIEELKAYAPLVEEQPFDRFFKKPVQEEHFVHRKSVSESEVPRHSSLNQEQTTSNSSNRAVYINLPSENKEEKETQSQPDKVQIIFEKSEPRESATKEPMQKSFSQSIRPAIGEPVILEENYSRSFDDIKKEYLEKVLRKKRNHSIDIRGLVKPALIILGLISLLAGGIFIGLSINKRGTNSTQKDMSREQIGVSDQQGLYPTKTIPVSSSISAKQPGKNAENKIGDDILGQDNSSSLNDKADAPVEKKKTKILKQKFSDSASAEKKSPAKTDSALIVKQREANRQADINVQKDNIKNNIEDYVSLSASNYNVGTFGGISDLQVTVSNTSPFSLDLVVVEVQYVQSNKKIFKTETLYFHNVSAGSAIMQEAPKSSRGVKVKYRITMINSPGLGISFTDI